MKNTMKVEQVNIKDLKANPKNPRKITQFELKKLVRSIKEFGFVDPIIVNNNSERNNIIVGGHQRVLAATKMGYKTVPVTYVDLDEDKENMLNIALNEISGDWDDQKLFDLLKDLQDKDLDVTLTGFDEPFIDELLSANLENAKNKDVDKTPEVPINPRSKLGEVYLLGDHRLMIGDSTNPLDFVKLMNNKMADACWTDPPYGVSYKGANHEVMNNDDLRDDDFNDFLEKVFKNMFVSTKEGAAMYTCYVSINHMLFEQSLNVAGWTVKQQLIWSKGHVLGRSDYHWCHEPILYCRRGEVNTSWFGDRTHKTHIMNSTVEDLDKLKKEELINIISGIRENSDVLNIKKDPHNSYVHPTQKPVELSQTMIKNSTRPREIILEPFCGSGSTLMACETSNRICYAMELDERYADVIILRYKEYVGSWDNIYRLNDDGSKTPVKEIFE